MKATLIADALATLAPPFAKTGLPAPASWCGPMIQVRALHPAGGRGVVFLNRSISFFDFSEAFFQLTCTRR
jgi:hypothetical protein